MVVIAGGGGYIAIKMIWRRGIRRVPWIVPRGASFSRLDFRNGRGGKRAAGAVLFRGGLAVLVLETTSSAARPGRGQHAAWRVLPAVKGCLPVGYGGAQRTANGGQKVQG